MPHPVLAPNTSDYDPDCEFGAELNLDFAEDKMNIDVSYTLHSEAIRNLIDNGMAKYFLIAKCSKTYRRDAHSTKDDKSIWELNSDDYLERVTFTPYIATVSKVLDFSSPEHLSDIRDFRPTGFDIPPGSILAVGNPIDLRLDPEKLEAIFDLVYVPELAPNKYQISLTPTTINILLSSKLTSTIKYLRQDKSGLAFSSLYLPALEHALRELEKHTESSWANSLKHILEVKELESKLVEDEPSSAHNVAQVLLEYPLEKMLQSLERGYDDE